MPSDPQISDEHASDEHAPDEQPVPSEAELQRIAEPARVRRAPKYSVFIGVGAVVGIVVALLLTLFLGEGDEADGAQDGQSSSVASGQGFISFLDGQGTIRFVMALTGGVVGGFAGGALAVAADRRSRDPLA
ncbi:histidine kinase [Cellulomonas composti]|uniref:Histidine kinase n=1 Tax=Cellulomonas composti TaxID=266130 RepID=A0A511JD84_9CELL|nr:histidine kinase [Cellulomonas composti]GEL95932.1 hypothetical protein CCO02nite_25900 [Cellulomonas composti]